MSRQVGYPNHCGKSACQQPWKMQQQRQQQDWHRVHGELRRMRFDRSPFIPNSFSEYIEHKHEVARIVDKSKENRMKCAQTIEFDRKILHDIGLDALIDEYAVKDRAARLSKITIWAPGSVATQTRAQAFWPGELEFREDGDERHTSGFGRFLPIPRVPGNPTVNWKQKPFLKPFAMDQVRPVPKKFDHIVLPRDYEVHEPEVNDNGVYIDDIMSSGRVSYGRTDPYPSSVIEFGYGDSHWGPAKEDDNNRQLYDIHASNGGRRSYASHSGSKSHFSEHDSDFKSLSSSESLSVESKNSLRVAKPVKAFANWGAKNRPRAMSRTEAMLESAVRHNDLNKPKLPGTRVTVAKSFDFADHSTEVDLLRDSSNLLQHYTQGNPVRSLSKPLSSVDPIHGAPITGRGPLSKPSSWRRASYGRNSFGRRDTIHEDGGETQEYPITLGETWMPSGFSTQDAKITPIQQPFKQTPVPKRTSISGKEPDLTPGFLRKTDSVHDSSKEPFHSAISGFAALGLDD